MTDKWNDDENCLKNLDVLMSVMKLPIHDFLTTMQKYFDDSPNSILLRIIGYASIYYDEGRNSGLEPKEAYHFMVNSVLQNPLAQQMFMLAGGNAMNKMAGVEE